MIRTQDGWIRCYEEKGALWIHDGNVKRPHALLTSGKHSNGFFNSGIVGEDPEVIEQACEDLSGCLILEGFDEATPDRVVGPAMGAITLAHGIAAAISMIRRRFMAPNCLCAFAEKMVMYRVISQQSGTESIVEADKLAQGDLIVVVEKPKMVFRRTTVKPGEKVLLCEDVLTTGSSVDVTAQAVTAMGGIVLPYVAVLVNRSGLTEVSGKQIVALIDRPMPTWTPDECPLCKQGSEAIRPKGKENWARLNAKY